MASRSSSGARCSCIATDARVHQGGRRNRIGAIGCHGDPDLRGRRPDTIGQTAALLRIPIPSCNFAWMGVGARSRASVALTLEKRRRDQRVLTVAARGLLQTAATFGLAFACGCFPAITHGARVEDGWIAGLMAGSTTGAVHTEGDEGGFHLRQAMIGPFVGYGTAPTRP